LPAFGNKVSIRLKVRKFYCHNSDCEKSIFAERFDGHFTPYKRVSDRLRKKLLKIALLTGGNAGEKLCKTLCIPVSSSTLIRLIHQQEPDAPITQEAIGIDDWAFRKGISYGTVIIDLNQRKIIDLLPNREAKTVENWLKSMPHVKVVTRDRYSRYAKGVTNGAPNAIQVADRWHLLKNMGDALQKLLERKLQELRRNCKSLEPIITNNESGYAIKNDTDYSSRRQLQLDKIKQLYSSGVGIRKIADALKMSRNTIRKYLHLNTPPAKNSAKTNISLFADYIQKRIDEDKEIKVVQLWKEIKENGYSGCRSVVYEYLKGYVKPHERIRMPKLKSTSWIPRKVSLLLYRKEDTLSKSDKELLDMLYEKSSDIRSAAILSGKFREIMENKQGELLNNWIDEVKTSSLKELSSFATGLLSDYSAVKNALTLPWSNGQVEGQVNKLKTIKRQMYGRASFSLLRKRMILFDM